jgi:hypothetical protein
MNNIVFSGKLEFLNLAELIQLIGNNGSSGVLRIQSGFEPIPAFIYFSNGNPVDAEFGCDTGLAALYTLFGWRSGDFSYSEEPARRSKAIHKNRMEIILDGLRMVDDGKIKMVGPEPSQNDLAASEPSTRMKALLRDRWSTTSMWWTRNPSWMERW